MHGLFEGCFHKADVQVLLSNDRLWLVTYLVIRGKGGRPIAFLCGVGGLFIFLLL